MQKTGFGTPKPNRNDSGGDRLLKSSIWPFTSPSVLGRGFREVSIFKNVNFLLPSSKFHSFFFGPIAYRGSGGPPTFFPKFLQRVSCFPAASFLGSPQRVFRGICNRFLGEGHPGLRTLCNRVPKRISRICHVKFQAYLRPFFRLIGVRVVAASSH